MFNPMTCSGWENGTAFLGPCTLSWVSLVIIIFLVMILRRQCSDGILAGTGFNLYGAIALGIGGQILTTFMFGSARWSLLAGLVGVIVGGYVLGLIMDTGGGE